jgi:hypothetical protein
MEVILRPATGAGAWRPGGRSLRRSGWPPPGLLGVGPRPRFTARAAWTAWAAVRTGRYGLTGRPWLALALVLRQTAAQSADGNAITFVTNQSTFYRATTWAPVLRLRLASPVEIAWPPAAQRSELLVTRLRRQETWTTRHEQETATRVFARYLPPETAPVPAGSWETAATPVPRVVVQPTPPAPPTAATAPPVPPGPPSAPRYWEDPARTSVPAPADIEQLTDHVLRSLDQRVVAARERLGKR